MSGLHKPRFVHRQNPSYVEPKESRYRGFSILMEPCTDEEFVMLRTTLCSRGDAFCRKDARSSLLRKQAEPFPVVKLPMYLAQLDCMAYGGKWTELTDKDKQWEANQWAWVWKYFL
jgi:hypothetical protein